MIESDLKSHNQSTNTTRRSSKTTTTSSYVPTTKAATKKLSETEIVGIVIGVLAVFIVLCIFIYFVYRRTKRRGKRCSPTVLIQLFSFGKKSVTRNPPSSACIKPHCQEYLNQFNLNEAYFASSHDKCWCSSCHNPPNSTDACGTYCRQQHGWVRFGLRISSAHQKQWHIFKEWKTCYYGTSSNRLTSIISNRFFPFDGDELNDGTTFTSGHPDQTCCTTSPSLAHASQQKFTTRSHFRAHDGTNYDVRLVLQCKQKPDTYRIEHDSASFHDIEWKTNTRASIVPYGLMVLLERR